MTDDSRADTVNGVDVSRRPLCPGEHQFAAYHGYCIICGADGWTASERRARAALRKNG